MDEEILAEIKGIILKNIIIGNKFYILVFTNRRIIGDYIGTVDGMHGGFGSHVHLYKKSKETNIEGTLEEILKKHKKNFFIDYNNIDEVNIKKSNYFPEFRIKLTEKVPILGEKPVFNVSRDVTHPYKYDNDVARNLEMIESIFMKVMPARTTVSGKSSGEKLIEDKIKDVNSMLLGMLDKQGRKGEGEEANIKDSTEKKKETEGAPSLFKRFIYFNVENKYKSTGIGLTLFLITSLLLGNFGIISSLNPILGEAVKIGFPFTFIFINDGNIILRYGAFSLLASDIIIWFLISIGIVYIYDVLKEKKD